jgi:hypothetical protein
MDNFAPGFPMKVFMAAWRNALGEKPLQVVAVSDIGHFGAQAFMHPEQYSGKAIGLAGDEVNLADMDKLFREKVGTPLPETYSFLGSALLWGVKEMGLMMKWFGEEGYGIDVQDLKKQHPGMLNLGEWMERKSKFTMVSK